MKTLIKWLVVYPIGFALGLALMIALSTWAVMIAAIVGLFSKNKKVVKISSITLVIMLILTLSGIGM